MKEVKLYYYSIHDKYTNGKFGWTITRRSYNTIYYKGAYYSNEYDAKEQYDAIVHKEDLDIVEQENVGVWYTLFTINPDLDIKEKINEFFDKKIKMLNKSRNELLKIDITYLDEDKNNE